MPPKKTPKVETPEVAYPFISVWVCASPEKSGVTPEQAGLVSSVFGLKNKPITLPSSAYRRRRERVVRLRVGNRRRPQVW